MNPKGTSAAQADERAGHARALCRVISELHKRGLCLATSGNFSLVLSRDPLQLLITPSGLDKGRLDPGDLTVVGSDGQPLRGEEGAPSAETRLHCAIATRARVGSVLHVHSVLDTLLGGHFLSEGGFVITGYEMLKGLAGVQSHEARVFVPVLANTQDMEALATEVDRVLDGNPGLCGLLLAGHGLYAWGETLAEAKRHVETFEFLFECLGQRTDFAPFTG